jgi:tRNA(fMet)-specific endonuclease VapC
MIFLDSDILSYYFSGNVKIRDKIIEAVIKKEQIALTTINVYELLKGFRWKNRTNKAALFGEFLKTVLVFTIDNSAISLAADIYADLRKSGNTVGDADILIAAIVISNNGMLISNNTKHYENIASLHLLNWSR